MRRRTRLITSLAVGLLASAGTVAFGWWWNQTYLPRRGDEFAAAIMLSPDGREWAWACFRNRWCSHGDADVAEVAERRSIGVDLVGAMPTWLDLTSRIAGAERGEGYYAECRYGFPWRCARVALYTAETPTALELRIMAGHSVGWVPKGYIDKGLVPSQPMWAGLFGDTALFTLTALAIFEGIAAARGRFRRSHHRCVGCGYSRAGLTPNTPCPECGQHPTTPTPPTPPPTPKRPE